MRPRRRLWLATESIAADGADNLLFVQAVSGLAEPALLDVLHALLATFWDGFKALPLRISEEQRHHFDTAVIEIAGNIIRYAYAPGHPGPLELVLHAYKEYVGAVFTDRGIRFEPQTALTTTMPRIAESTGGEAQAIAGLPEGGFGLALVRMTIDRLEYERTADGQNRWILLSHIRA